jgi:hypothetical protein
VLEAYPSKICHVKESRTEIRCHPCYEVIFPISAKEHGQSADTKHTTIAVSVTSHKLLEGSRDVGKQWIGRHKSVYDPSSTTRTSKPLWNVWDAQSILWTTDVEVLGAKIRWQPPLSKSEHLGSVHLALGVEGKRQ